jgi:hypothetical protein
MNNSKKNYISSSRFRNAHILNALIEFIIDDKFQDQTFIQTTTAVNVSTVK